MRDIGLGKADRNPQLGAELDHSMPLSSRYFGFVSQEQIMLLTQVCLELLPVYGLDVYSSSPSRPFL